ncbi:MAG: adenosylcobalamin-dependent ribonucleoside-diphosphate reductase [Nitrospirae bacterium]|nr:MAG: adenosylcobalamin-dependent ribonucleoside-diphosphate reductase [Nitrospirota bacterium]
MTMYLQTDIAKHIWHTRYRYIDDGVIYDKDIEDTWRRVAKALAGVEKKERNKWRKLFYGIMEDFKFLPGGRILAGAGTNRSVTLFNCFVMGNIRDSIEGIFEALMEGAITMQHGGGVGYDFSTLRPKGRRAKKTGAIASGPVSFMHIWDSMCATILSTGARRGAMMATLRCDHPDIKEFIEAKKEKGRLRYFNLSVQISDDFMRALKNDEEWPLIFPLNSGRGDIIKRWPGKEGPVPCNIEKRIRAKELWSKLMHSTYTYAEPGILFVDRINRMNNLWYREYITATNPCGEVPLPPYGACDLGSINLTRFVKEPFTKKAELNIDKIRETVSIAVRMLDNVIEASLFPLDKQKSQVKGCRRIGLGITGLADALIMLNITYGSEESLKISSEIMKEICYTAYRSSIEIAKEKGAFPFLDKRRYLEGPFISSLPIDIKRGISTYGIRNSHLIAIAPTGTTSMLANNISSGIEPVFDFSYKRRILDEHGNQITLELSDYAWSMWKKRYGDKKTLPESFVKAHDLPPIAHIEMQAALQPYVDNSISKTINIPEDYPFDDFKNVYEIAYEKGLKGCTTFRPNPITGEVLRGVESWRDAPHCCTIERQGD